MPLGADPPTDRYANNPNSGLLRLISSYRANAKRRGLEWRLSTQQVDTICKGDCFYCGISPLFVRRRGAQSYTYNGIDRLSNHRGYTPENTVPCCFTCNRAKHCMLPEEFIAWAKRLAKHLGLLEVRIEGDA